MNLDARRSPARTLLVTGLALLATGCGEDRSPAAPTPMPQMVAAPPAPSPTPEPAPAPVPAPETARYSVTFDATWRRETHPQDFPDDAHFSGLIGGTHRSTASFWREGVLATLGIRNMAERGMKGQLTEEVEAAIAAGTAQFVLSGGNIERSPGSVTLDFDISQSFPLVTLVTMVAPSPDWFVGVHDLPLFENGAWRDEVRLELPPYDAGTDSGVTYRSPDEETQPRQLIARLTGFPFLNGGQVLPLGTFTFRRIQ